MPDWSTYTGVCPQHPHTLVHQHRSHCVSCAQEAEAADLEAMWRGARIQSVFEKRALKLEREAAKKDAERDFTVSEADTVAKEFPRGTLLIGTRFDYEIISRSPSAVDNGKRTTYKVRVRNTKTKTTRWLNVSTLRQRLRRGDWELELP